MVKKERLIEVLYKYGRAKARFLADFIPGGASKKEVNSVLYSNPSDFIVDASYYWKLTPSTFDKYDQKIKYRIATIDKIKSIPSSFGNPYLNKLIDLDDTTFERAVRHAIFLCQNENIAYVNIREWFQVVILTDAEFDEKWHGIVKDTEIKRRLIRSKIDKENRIKTICKEYGFSASTTDYLVRHIDDISLQKRLDDITQFNKRNISSGIDVSKAVIMSESDYLQYKNSVSITTTRKSCSGICSQCTRTECVLDL